MNLLPHSLAHTVKQGGASREDNVLEKVLADVLIALLHGVVTVFVDSLKVEAGLLGVEHYFGGSEALIADQNLSAIGEFVVLLTSVGVFGILDSSVEVVDNITHLLLDVSHDLKLSVGSERIATLVEDLLQVSSDVSTSKVNSLDCVGDSITLINRDGVGDTISRVSDDSGGSSI